MNHIRPVDLPALIAARLRRRGLAPAYPGLCEWFLKCSNPATTVTPHPILGNVPTCQSCADFAR